MLSPQFTSVTLENFRGVSGSQTFDLDAPVVLFWGPNGTGKTTVFDGLLWLLQGTLPRLKSHALRKNDEYVVSAYGARNPARVQAQIRIGSVTMQLERTGTSTANTLVIRDQSGAEVAGSDAERNLRDILSEGSLSLEELLATSGILQQDDLRQILRDKPDARYRQLLRLLGLESLELFGRFAEGEAKAARSDSSEAKARLDDRRSRAAAIRDQIETAESLSAMSVSDPAELQALRLILDSQAPQVALHHDIASLAELDALVADIGLAHKATISAGQIVRELPGERITAEGSLDSLNALCDQSEVMYRQALGRVESLSAERDRIAARHDQMISLVALAIPLLQAHADGELTTCPVCATKVDVSATVERLAGSSQSSAELADAELAVSEANERVLTVRAELNAARLAREAFIARQRDAQLLNTQLRELAINLEKLFALEAFRIPKLGSAGAGQWMAGLFDADATRDRLLQVLDEASQALADLSSRASSARHRAVVREDSLHRGSQIPQLRAALEVVESEILAATDRYDAARRKQTTAEGLQRATSAATSSIFEDRFRDIEPLMNDIYSRLDPHPTFTRLDFAIEPYRGRGTAMASVTDELSDVQANPLLVFSAAQANVVVLSAFLALGWAAGSNGLPFVLMDDPLQSLDDVNVLGFSDLVGQLRTRKQVMLSTHDERFARLLERKLTMSRTSGPAIVHRFLGWTREGPQVETRIPGRPILGDIAL